MKYLFKTVNALLAISIIPAAIFLECLFVQVSTSLVDAGLEESFSLMRFYDIFISGEDPFSYIVQNLDGPFIWPEALDPMKPYLIAFAVFFALAVITALFIFVWSICSSKRIPVIIASAVGIVFSILMSVFFGQAAEFLTSGEINIVQALSNGGFLASLLGGLVSIDTFALGDFKNAFVIIFILIILWTSAFIVVDIGDNDNDEAHKKG